jgi:ABC-type multidrug transport system ATPase subunit
VFGEGDARTVAVDDVSLEIPMGRMVYIVGPSGSGKTTLPSMVSGILRPTSGRVLIKGVDVWGLSASDDARAIGVNPHAAKSARSLTLDGGFREIERLSLRTWRRGALRVVIYLHGKRDIVQYVQPDRATA